MYIIRINKKCKYNASVLVENRKFDHDIILNIPKFKLL